MHTPADDGTSLTLIILRLMDADLLFPEEGRALLAEVKAFDQAQGGAMEERELESRKAFVTRLEALLQAERQEASVARQVQAIVYQILHQESDPN